MPKYVNRYTYEKCWNTFFLTKECTVYSEGYFALKVWKLNLHSKIVAHFHPENSRLETKHTWQIPRGKRKQGFGDNKRAEGTKINCDIVYFITYTIENVLKYLILTRYSYSSSHPNFLRLQSPFFCFQGLGHVIGKSSFKVLPAIFFLINFVSKNFKHNKGTQMALNKT